MRVLMINSVCGRKSTGRICTDLANKLVENGHEVKIAYGMGPVPNQFDHFAIPIDSYLDIRLHGLKARLSDGDCLGSNRATRKFLRWVDDFKPDIIHLHNIHGYYINAPLLFQYINENNIKTIWTLHDMWSFTGHGCTCDAKKCEKWKTECNSCPAIGDYPSSLVDRSKRNYYWKKRTFSSIKDLTLVAPSNWLANLLKNSYLKHQKIEVIHNGIDLNKFKPTLNNIKRDFNITDKILIMGCSTTWSAEKGLYDFYKLAEKIDDRFKIILVGLTKKQISNLPKAIIGIERTNSVEDLAQLYSASDVFLNLTYGDNYPTVNLEALACGTPVFTYQTGGSAECLDENNGLAFTQGDLDGIADYLNNKYEKNSFSASAKIEMSQDAFAESYMRLYLNY